MTMRGLRIAFAALCALWLAVSTAIALDLALIGQAERAIDGYRTDLTRIATELQSPAVTEAPFAGNRCDLKTIRTRAADQSLKLQGPLSELRQQIASLGPAPSEEKPEPSGVAEERTALQASLDRVQSIKSRLDVIAVEAEQLAGRISTLQRDQFFQRIFETGRSILNPVLWYDTSIGIGVLVTRLAGLFTNWWTEVRATANMLGLGLIPLFVVLFGAAYSGARRAWLRWTDTHVLATQEPDDIRRLWRVVRGQMTTLALLIILLAPIFLALRFGGFMTPRFELVFTAAVNIIAGTFFYYIFAHRVAAPGLRSWRILDIDDTAAARLPILVGLTAFVSVANRKLIEVADGLYLPVTYTIGQSALAALAMLVLISLIVLTLRNQSGLEDRTPARRVYFSWAGSLTVVVWLLVAVGLGALVLGYLALANYISQQLFRTGVLVMVLFLLHHLSDAAVAASFDSQSGFGRFFRRVTGMGERAIERLGLLFRTVVDLLLVVTGLPLLFLLWTFTWVDFRGLINSAMLGLRIGDITLSPWTIILLVMTLGGGVIVTNLVIGWLDRRILSETRIDKGVQDSLRKSASYAGYILAALVALTAAGLDFSSLALVFGALGVGIGLGLQSIVNNFVSGLILLAERPIRVGDWVAIPAGEGIVKRINVRSTEIETFDSCSIIVPNSALITEPVRNWTHGDNMGRFTVAITVEFETDPETVRAVLVDLARAHPTVMTYPEPTAVLVRFGQTGLDFELRGYVADVLQAALVASDLRFALLKAFREKGITIPHPLGLLQAAQK